MLKSCIINKYICYRQWTVRWCLTQNQPYRTAHQV